MRDADRRMSGCDPQSAFLLPGLFGDEPKLRALRERLRGHVDLVLLDVPDVGSPPALLSSLAAMGSVVVDDIARRRPTGAISIVGFSFGASLALEVAAQLGRAGRRVERLCVLDGAFTGRDLRRPSSVLIRLSMTPSGAVSVARRALHKMQERLRLAQARRRPASVFVSQPARRAFIAHHRDLALKGWVPEACPAPGVAILSESLGAGSRRSWSELCPNLRSVTLRAAHGDLLEREALDQVVAILDREFNPAAGERPGSAGRRSDAAHGSALGSADAPSDLGPGGDEAAPSRGADLPHRFGPRPTFGRRSARPVAGPKLPSR